MQVFKCNIFKLSKRYEYIPHMWDTYRYDYIPDMHKLIQTYGTGSKARWYIFFMSFFTQFTLFVYKSLIIVAENVHRIPLDLALKDTTCCRNERAYRSNLASMKSI